MLEALVEQIKRECHDLQDAITNRAPWSRQVSPADEPTATLALHCAPQSGHEHPQGLLRYTVSERAESLHGLHALTGLDAFVLVTVHGLGTDGAADTANEAVWETRRLGNATVRALAELNVEAAVFWPAGKRETFDGCQWAASTGSSEREWRMLRTTLPEVLGSLQDALDSMRNFAQSTAEISVEMADTVAVGTSTASRLATLHALYAPAPAADVFRQDPREFWLVLDRDTDATAVSTPFATRLDAWLEQAAQCAPNHSAAAPLVEFPTQDPSQMSLATLTRTLARDLGVGKLAQRVDAVSLQMGRFLLQAVAGAPEAPPNPESGSDGHFDRSPEQNVPAALLQALANSVPVTLGDKDTLERLAREIFACPLSSLLHRLCWLTAGKSGLDAPAPPLHVIWPQLVLGLRDRWREGTRGAIVPLVERVTVESAGGATLLGTSLLHQKLVQLNYCGEVRSHWRRLENGAASPQDPNSGTMRLLNADAPLIVPPLQPPELLTEDALQQRHAELERLSSSPNAAARLQSQHLMSDMSAFKAANGPLAVFEDFVRWHSPRDWTLVDGLSPRMRDPKSLWQHLWAVAPCVAARDQTPLVDADADAAAVLDYLEGLSLGDVAARLAPCLVVAALGAVAESVGPEAVAAATEQLLASAAWSELHHARDTAARVRAALVLRSVAVPVVRELETRAGRAARLDGQIRDLDLPPLRAAQQRSLCAGQPVLLDTAAQRIWAKSVAHSTSSNVLARHAQISSMDTAWMVHLVPHKQLGELVASRQRQFCA